MYTTCTLCQGHSNTVNCLAFSLHGEYLASGGEDGLLIVWNVNTRTTKYRDAFESPVLCVSWSSWRSETLVFGSLYKGTAFVSNLAAAVSRSCRINFPIDTIQALHPSKHCHSILLGISAPVYAIVIDPDSDNIRGYCWRSPYSQSTRTEYIIASHLFCLNDLWQKRMQHLSFYQHRRACLQL